MNWLIIKNDLKRNRMINLALFLFMMLSASLGVLSVVIGVQTYTSIAELYEVAEPPHFLQMHKGELDQGELEQFMASNPDVTHWQAHKMLTAYGDEITIVNDSGSYDLSDNHLDIGLVRQNESKDLLLNAQHEKVVLEAGEIGMPVLLKDRYDLEIGDVVLLSKNNEEFRFTISEIILDAQMNSSMTSSTRILLSDADYGRLDNIGGESEYIIEVYFTDSSLASDFQTAYEQAGLPRNGPAVTYTIMFLLSALTDIVMVFILLLMSILLIIIAFICLRFTIMAALEEEVKEIGTMKAIGLTFHDIRDIYLNKYKALALVAVIAGYIAAIAVRGLFTRHISETFGAMPLSPLVMILSLVTAFLIYFFIIQYCKKILKKIKNLTVVDALVSGNGFEKNGRGSRDGLHQSKKLTVNSTMALREVLFSFKNWAMVFMVVFIGVLIILIPANLLNTLQSREFVTYMGSSLEDILIEVDNGENLESNYRKVKDVLDDSSDISSFYEYRRVSVETTDADGEMAFVHVDTGAHSGHSLQYLEGGAPEGNDEIAISYLNATKLSKAAGDEIFLEFMGQTQPFIVSGVYQDVTSGGYTAKAQYDFPGAASERYSFAVNLNDSSRAGETAKEWSDVLGSGVSVDPMEAVVDQTLGGVSRQLETIVLIIAAMGLFLVMLIAVLFLKLRLARDMPEIGILKALGFSRSDILHQYLLKMGVVALGGLTLGLLVTNLVGESLVNAALSISGLGLKEVTLIIDPLIQYLALPLLVIAIIFMVTRYALGHVGKYNTISAMNQ